MSTETIAPVGRLEVLDGFRGVACLAVVGYHYFSRWTIPLNPTNLYPYGDVLARLPCFRYGYLGVNLFFLVSGFVISLTLMRCGTWREFVVRRAARLIPAMVLAASATFVVIRLLPPHFWTVTLQDFLPSLTFTDPFVYKKLIGLDTNFMDGAYWSLFVEVRFYAWAALLYFAAKPGTFLRNSAVVMNVSIAVLLLKNLAPDLPHLMAADLLLFPEYAPWLFAGVALFFIWRDKSNWLAWSVVVESLLTVIGKSIVDARGLEWALIIGIYALFIAFSMGSNTLRVFGVRWLTRAGAASYTLYLLHQEIGVTVIGALSGAADMTGPRSAMIAVFVVIGLAFASVMIYEYYEVPARRQFVRRANRLFAPAGVVAP